MQVHRGARRRNRRPWQLIVDVAAAAFLLTFIIYQVRFLAIQLQPPRPQNLSSSTVAGSKDPPSSASLQLGFPYPQLHKSRALLLPILSQQEQFSWAKLTAAYGAALHALQQGHNTSSTTADTRDHDPTNSSLQKFLQEAFSLLSADAGLLRCGEDATLLAAWHTAAAPPPPTTTTTITDAESAPFSPTALQDRHYLLAANLHNSAGVLPNMIMQTLQLALLLPHGHVAVSLYESGSSDTSRMWLTLLHQLLLPLGVPHHITVGGDLSPHLQLGRIELLAALRNALLEPWMTHSKEKQQHKRQQQLTEKVKQRSWLQKVWVQHNATGSPARAAAGFAILQHNTAGYMPDTLLFANDVFFCAEDVLRLVMHDADIACGMDFYTAPWQQQQQGGSSAASSGSRSSMADSSSEAHERQVAEADDQLTSITTGNVNRKQYQSNDRTDNRQSSSGAVSDTADDDDDDFFDPYSQQLQQGAAAPSTAGHGSLRFYDKWVARDAAGGRLHNAAPFVAHRPTQVLLAEGQPVAMSCCWNGLTAVTAAPFQAGLRFRSHQPGECQASECSLMCDDFARLGFTHVVMDPAVRLAYELEQVDSIGGAATPLAPTTAARGDITAAAQDVTAAAVHDVASLGPRLPWKEVAAASQRLAAAAAQSRTAAAAAVRYVECCDLQPGQSYVNFRQDCHMVDIMAHNYTADVWAA